MSDNIVEQAENSASKIGKFNTADDLLAAYNALESEFTKRCQLVKQLQTELESLRAQAEAAPPEQENVVPPEPENSAEKADSGVTAESASMSAADVPSECFSEPAPLTPDQVLNIVLQNACEYADRLCAVPEIMDACIALYKQRLIQPQSKTSPKGYAVIVPAKRPTTLSEAKRLADALLGSC